MSFEKERCILAREVNPIDTLLRIGLRVIKMGTSLALFKEGNLSLWKAARLAGVSLREMTQYAIAQGVRAVADEETIATPPDKLAYRSKEQLAC